MDGSSQTFSWLKSFHHHNLVSGLWWCLSLPIGNAYPPSSLCCFVIWRKIKQFFIKWPETSQTRYIILWCRWPHGGFLLIKYGPRGVGVSLIVGPRGFDVCYCDWAECNVAVWCVQRFCTESEGKNVLQCLKQNKNSEMMDPKCKQMITKRQITQNTGTHTHTHEMERLIRIKQLKSK